MTLGACSVWGMVGFLINSIQFMFQIPEPKLAKLKRSLESLILDGYATYRELACLAGFIISLSLALLLVYSLDRFTFFFLVQALVGCLVYLFRGLIARA